MASAMYADAHRRIDTVLKELFGEKLRLIWMQVALDSGFRESWPLPLKAYIAYITLGYIALWLRYMPLCNVIG